MVARRDVLCSLVYLVVAVHAAEESSLEECLKKDSVSCVRDEIFRSIKSYFGQGSVDFLEEVFADKVSAGSEVRDGEGASSRGFLSSKDPRERRAVHGNGGVESPATQSKSDISDLSGVANEGQFKYTVYFVQVEQHTLRWIR